MSGLRYTAKITAWQVMDVCYTARSPRRRAIASDYELMVSCIAVTDGL